MPLPPLQAPTAQRQTLDQIMDWYAGMVDALVLQRAHVQRLIATGGAPPPRFVSMTEADLDAYYDNQRAELDRLTSFNLVASTEASLRTDFARRLHAKLTDALSSRYRAWHANLPPAKQRLPDFDEAGILDQLKEARVLDNNIVGRFRECLKPRHWVGHGRYWAKHSDVDRLVPQIVYHRATELLNALPP